MHLFAIDIYTAKRYAIDVPSLQHVLIGYLRRSGSLDALVFSKEPPIEYDMRFATAGMMKFPMLNLQEVMKRPQRHYPTNADEMGCLGFLSDFVFPTLYQDSRLKSEYSPSTEFLEKRLLLHCSVRQSKKPLT